MILSISVINKESKKGLIWWSCVTIACWLFAVIYKHLGHGVTSAFMSYMFLYPLLFGVGGCVVLVLKNKTALMKVFAMKLYGWGIITLVMGNMLRGIFDIAGTGSYYVYAYWIVGGVLLLAGIIGLLGDNAD